MDSGIKIIGYTENPDRIASCSARISTTTGDALTVFEKAVDSEKNRALVEKVISSGHTSTIEHISFNLAFVNVSVYVEQFMVEFRLASFTVKSRRYVDFSGMGYVVPDFTDTEGNPLPKGDAERLSRRYREHMDFLFREYGVLISAGIPKEDARFLLPYSLKSNFYCTVNARELCNILYSMLYGRGSAHPELYRLGQELLRQAKEICPFIFDHLTEVVGGTERQSALFAALLDRPASEGKPSDAPVELLHFTGEPEKAVAAAALIGYAGLSSEQIDACLRDPALTEKIIGVVLSNRRPRELEQINFTFRLNNVSLAAVTHLTRHRMQSLIVPPLHDACRCGLYMIPGTVRAEESLLQRYRDAFARSKELYEDFRSSGVSKYDAAYLFMSGNVIDVTTTMNGRELQLFLRLRTCNRAQWETRGIAIRMLNEIRRVSPLLFGGFGPGCFMNGVCPEGKMCCGKAQEVRERFSMPLVLMENL